MPQKMQQIQISSYGKAEVLDLVSKPIPDPQPGELLIRMEAAGVNYSDVLRRRNTYFMPTPLPYTLGAEAVGEVIARGAGVNEGQFQNGQRVLAILPYGGGYSEYLTASAAYCIPLPPNISATAATALFVQGSTAHLILHQVAGDITGKTVLIHAAAGGVGSLLVQLAKLAGAKVVAAAGTASKLKVAEQLGADAGVNYSQTDWTNRVIGKNGGEKVDLILEMVGGRIFTESFTCLKAGGTMIVYGAASGEKGIIHSEHYVDESHHLQSFNLAHFIQHKPEQWQASLGAMIGLLAEGKIEVLVDRTYSLAEAALAHQQLEDRKTTGKLVLVP